MSFYTRVQRWLRTIGMTGSDAVKYLLGVASVVGVLTAVYVSAQTGGGFSNGFEGGDLGGWTIESDADFVGAIEGAEGASLFPIYSDLLPPGESVEPYNGDWMLRMGTPKTKNETQNRGVNAISQTFTADSGAISVALRLFSLDHRGDDSLRISLTADDGTEVAPDEPFDLENGTVCNVPSCDVLIDVGKRKDVIATDWQVLRFSGLDLDRSYTLRIELEAGQNESLASWLYVDGVNEPPSAVIRYNPSEGLVEGDFVVFDCLLSEDPEGGEFSCIWTVSIPSISPDPIKTIGSTVVYSFPDNASYTVNLEVTDGEHSATTDVTVTPQEQVALVNALDVEVLPGGTVDLVCRFADPGVLDAHSVSISVNSDTIVNEVEVVENLPALHSGFARATYQADPGATGSISGTCEVDGSVDCIGGVGCDDFTISVVTDLGARVASNSGSTQNNPPELYSGKSTLGGLETPSSVAVYKLTQPDGSDFPQGTEVSVTAHFPVDYDIVIFGESDDASVRPWNSAPFVSAPFVSAPFVSVPFVSAPFVSAPFVSVPFVSAPFVSAPFVSVPFVSAPFVSAPFVSAPFVSAPLLKSLWLDPGFRFENFPLSQLAGAPDGSNISGFDVAIDDLGALGFGVLFEEPLFVKGLSAEFGSNTEQVLIKVSPGERALYLAVVPQSGSFSSAPFNIEVEASIPPPAKALLGDACTGTPLVPSSDDMAPAVYGDKTLIVTQRERMMATFNMGPEDWTAFIEGMEPFFVHVEATVISVPSDWYTDADMNPCDVQRQNELAEGIKTLIANNRTGGNTQYVQIMGSLDIVPPYYVPDETQTGNEALFASDLLTKPGSPLGVAIGEGYMLTDAFYVDDEPQPLNGRELYLEDISVSRMVESPDEILANAKRFMNAGGVINLVTAEANGSTRSTGYDFFIDGTAEVESILDQVSGGKNLSLNNNTWDAEALRCNFFGAGQGCETPVSALNVVNAHMSYNAGLTAKGFNCEYLSEQFPGLCGDAGTDPLGEVFLSTESAGIYDDPDGDPDLGFPAINGVTFSIGCHSGLSVPDAWGLDTQALPLDPARDWVQELGTWVGSYNFAYGDTDVSDRGTEGIMTLVIDNFAQGMTLGQALVQAKQQYATGLFEFGVYDEKSLVGLNLFGMPQATLEGGVGESVLASAFATGASISGESVGALEVTLIEEDEETIIGGDIQRKTSEKGVEFSIDGKSQAIVGRPLLPVIKPSDLQLRPVGEGTSVHGVALRGGTFTTYRNLDPVFPAQTHDLVTSISEPQPCVETLSPSLIALMNTFVTGDDRLQSFIAQPGQFQCTNVGAQYVEGDFRIWNSLTLELMHPVNGASDGDQRPPEVTKQDLLRIPGTDDVSATLDAMDEESGIREVIALVYSSDEDTGGADGIPGRADAYSNTMRGENGFEFVLVDAFDKLMSFQYIDNAGNITAKTLKGALLRAIEVSIITDIINLEGNTEIIIHISDFRDLIAPYIIVDFGDGAQTNPEVFEFDDPELDLTINEEDGSATVIFLRNYSDVPDPITIKVEVRAAGALGTDEKTISRCSDPVDFPAIAAEADIIGCSVTSEDTQLTIDVILLGSVSDGIQYRLVLPQTNTQIKYSAGSTTGPNKIKPMGVPVGDNRISFTFDAGKLGWDGTSPFEFQFETQDGVPGEQGQGFVDTTDVKTYLQ